MADHLLSNPFDDHATIARLVFLLLLLYSGNVKASPAVGGTSNTTTTAWIWDVMKDDRIPLSVTSVLVALLVMLLGLILNLLLVLLLVKGYKYLEKSNKSGGTICIGIKNGVGGHILEEEDDHDETLRKVKVENP